MQTSANDGFQQVKNKRQGPRSQKNVERNQNVKETTSDNKKPGERLTFKELLFELNNLKKHQHSPKVDLNETAHNFYVRFELPGVSPDDIKIYVRDSQFLLVSGTKHESTIQDDNTSVYSECKYGFFTRRVKVSSRVTNKFDTLFDNGVLYITLYKMEVKLDARLDEEPRQETQSQPQETHSQSQETQPLPQDTPLQEIPPPLDFSKLNFSSYTGSWADEI